MTKPIYSCLWFDNQVIDFDEISDSLNERYIWIPTDTKNVLIRSGEFNEQKSKTFHFKQWTYLAKAELETLCLSGYYSTQFNEPEVMNFATILGVHFPHMN